MTSYWLYIDKQKKTRLCKRVDGFNWSLRQTSRSLVHTYGPDGDTERRWWAMGYNSEAHPSELPGNMHFREISEAEALLFQLVHQ
jgi:hypothetical protein